VPSPVSSALATNVRCYVLCSRSASRETYTLSLHDALPISPRPATPTVSRSANWCAGQRPDPGGVAAGPAPTVHCGPDTPREYPRSEEHTSELQSRENLVCRLLLEKKKTKDVHKIIITTIT